MIDTSSLKEPICNICLEPVHFDGATCWDCKNKTTSSRKSTSIPSIRPTSVTVIGYLGVISSALIALFGLTLILESFFGALVVSGIGALFAKLWLEFLNGKEWAWSIAFCLQVLNLGLSLIVGDVLALILGLVFAYFIFNSQWWFKKNR